MFSTLRSRLSLTYLLLIGLVLFMAALMMALVVRNIPVRTTTIRLQELTRILPAELDMEDPAAEQQAETLRRIAAQYDVRILIIGRLGVVLFDTGTGSLPGIERIPPPAAPQPGDPSIPSGSVRDADGRTWQFVSRPLSDRRSLVLASPRPPFQWLNAFRDELLPPLLWASGIAILLGIGIAGLTARWVSRPLGRIAAAARKVPEGSYTHLEEVGPQEVQQLSRAFNDMAHQVQVGRQSQRDFVANVSHELKTPLTAIQGFAGAILDGTAASQDEIERAAGVISDEAGRMHRLVLDLLDLARIEGGAVQAQQAPVDLAGLLETLIQKFDPRARAGAIELHKHLEAVPPVRGDGDRLLQVFANLLENAVNHTPAGGRVEIQLKRVKDAAVIAFSDSGPGIPPDKQDRIFERFYQVDESRARSKEQAGFGLGLAIANEIVQAHGGQILLDSRPGQGSVFSVRLPFSPTSSS